METSYVIEQLENIRRTAERGLKMAQRTKEPYCSWNQLIDVFQHILDETNRTRTAITPRPESVQLSNNEFISSERD